MTIGISNRLSSWYGITYLKKPLTQPILYSFLNTCHIIGQHVSNSLINHVMFVYKHDIELYVSN